MQGAGAPETTILSLIFSGSLETKIVVGLCALFSISSWYVIVAKWWEFKGFNARQKEYEAAIRPTRSIEEREQAVARLSPSPFTTVTHVAARYMLDVKRAMEASNVSRTGLSLTQLEALMLALDADVKKSGEDAGRSLPWLATIGSTAPLLGLFGTVLGIINAFINIGKDSGTSLQTVGPNIADALIATAAGLLAAIPAVMAYNIFTARTSELEGKLERVAQETIGLLGREGKL